MTELQWMQIYRDTIHPLYGYMARRTAGNREMTEDIIQETYLRALDQWNRKPLPRSPLAWLKRVAGNILIDYIRKNRREEQKDLESQPDQSSRSTEDRLKSLEIFQAISTLGKKKAKILEAFYFDGKSVKEIADEMAISERAVEGQLRRARQSLKSILPDTTKNGENNE